MNPKDNWLKAAFIILLLGPVLLFFCNPLLLIPSQNIKIVVAMFTVPAFFLTVILLSCGIAHGKNMWRELKLKPLNADDIGPILSSILFFFLFALTTFLVSKLGYNPPPQELVGFAVDCPLWLFLCVLFSAGVCAPIAEELAYRCVIGGFFESVFPEGKWAYYLIPSILFALSHGLIWQSVQLFFFALYLQWHYKKGSSTRVILMHAMLNWCSLSILILTRIGLVPATAV